MNSPDITEVVVIGDCANVTLHGELDVGNCGALSDALADAVAAPHLTIDVRDVRFLDRHATGLIVDAIHRVRIEGGTAELINVPKRVRRVVSLIDAEVSVTPRVD